MNQNLTDGKILLVIRGLVESEKGEVLLLKRNKERSYNPLKWELPGGKLLPGETMDCSIERILNKETNLYVANIGNHHYIQNRYVTEPGKYHGYSYFEITLTADYVAGEPRISKDDHEELLWVDRNKSLNLDLSIESKKTLVMHIKSLKDKNNSAQNTIVVSRALISDENGKFLIMKRSDGQSYSGKWEIPGGKLQSFEAITEHLIREILEETGLVIDVSQPALYMHSYIPKDGKHRSTTFVNIISMAAVRSGKIRLSREHSEYKWVSAGNILKYDIADYLLLPITEILIKK